MERTAQEAFERYRRLLPGGIQYINVESTRGLPSGRVFAALRDVGDSIRAGDIVFLGPGSARLHTRDGRRYVRGFVHELSMSAGRELAEHLDRLMFLDSTWRTTESASPVATAFAELRATLKNSGAGTSLVVPGIRILRFPEEPVSAPVRADGRTAALATLLREVGCRLP